MLYASARAPYFNRYWDGEAVYGIDSNHNRKIADRAKRQFSRCHFHTANVHRKHECQKRGAPQELFGVYLEVASPCRPQAGLTPMSNLFLPSTPASLWGLPVVDRQIYGVFTRTSSG